MRWIERLLISIIITITVMMLIILPAIILTISVKIVISFVVVPWSPTEIFSQLWPEAFVVLWVWCGIFAYCLLDTENRLGIYFANDIFSGKKRLNFLSATQFLLLFPMWLFISPFLHIFELFGIMIFYIAVFIVLGPLGLLLKIINARSETDDKKLVSTQRDDLIEAWLTFFTSQQRFKNNIDDKLHNFLVVSSQDGSIFLQKPGIHEVSNEVAFESMVANPHSSTARNISGKITILKKESAVKPRGKISIPAKAISKGSEVVFEPVKGKWTVEFENGLIFDRIVGGSIEIGKNYLFDFEIGEVEKEFYHDGSTFLVLSIAAYYFQVLDYFMNSGNLNEQENYEYSIKYRISPPDRFSYITKYLFKARPESISPPTLMSIGTKDSTQPIAQHR